jgi:DNA (cytosine-5)-methyltransferase 1
MKSPTVGDLFCGAGGFSEGFRQAGFKIEWAVDNWKPAYTTYEKNLGISAIKDDVIDIDFETLPKVDVLIGSPPCQPFSLANKAGGGDIKKGLRMVAKFIEAAKAVEAKYWIMENVANLKPYLQHAWQIDKNRFTRRETLEFFSRMDVIDCSAYGVPQRRKRLFSGNFPMPLPKDYAEIPMRQVVNALPYPIEGVKGQEETVVWDPLYGIPIKASKLTDHFSIDTSLDEHSWRMAEQEKTRHRWAGHMKFPDDPLLPSRTICATSQRSGRQTIVIEDSRGAKGLAYRTPSIRESACLQGFPITYQFYASNLADKQTLVGNAVPPPVARALALSIREGMKSPYHGSPLFDFPSELPPEIKVNPRKTQHRIAELRLFQRSVAGLPADCRVELDNEGKASAPPGLRKKHLKGWRVVFYLGYAREYAAFELDLDTAMKLARMVLQTRPILDSESVLRTIIERSEAEFESIPDATTLQEIWTGRNDSPKGPYWVLSKVESICESVVGKPDLKTGVKAREFASIIEKKCIGGGKERDSGKWKNQTVDAYVVCSVVSLAIATTLANSGIAGQRRLGKDTSILDLGQKHLLHD